MINGIPHIGSHAMPFSYAVRLSILISAGRSWLMIL